ncbi:MAG: DUF6350 family protein [Microbacterium sp.]|uniref:cell division protein PerM n=1 Tax=Microbacterium sp. TaxID=51671 RepID=UPI0039E4DCD0
MHRVLVALLSAFDAVIAAAAAIAAVLAPLTLLWVFGSEHADWSWLWPTAASVWQLGNLVPLPVALPDLYLARTGIESDAAAFTLSLAPLAFASFTAIFAARSGARAAGAAAWATGTATGTGIFAALAAVVALTSRNPVAHPALWQAVLAPAALYGAFALVGALTKAWRDGDDGVVDRLHEWVDGWRGDWPAVPGLAVRGAAVALAALVGLGALATAVAVFARVGSLVALYEAGHVDVVGATVVTLGQLMYLPTLVVWGMSWIAGPGFALGTGTAVSPAGTQLGVVPGIPILGAVPESVSSWLLLVLVLPVGVGALAGWVVRSRLVAGSAGAEPVGPRVVLAVAVSALAGAGAALLAAVASGSLGPGRLASVGPAPGPLAFAVGVEVMVGAAILLLAPRRGEASAPPVSLPAPPASFAGAPVSLLPSMSEDRADVGGSGANAPTFAGFSDIRTPAAADDGEVAEGAERDRPPSVD